MQAGRRASITFTGGLPEGRLQQPWRRTLSTKRTTRSARGTSTAGKKATGKTPARKAAVVRKAPAKKAAKPRPKTQASAQSRKLLETILASLDADKAEDIVSIDTSGRTPMADFMVVASGRSNRHVAAIAEHLMQLLKADGLNCRVEGLQQGDWVLVDAVDIIVHLFRPEVRQFYNLEQMWSSGRPATSAG